MELIAVANRIPARSARRACRHSRRPPGEPPEPAPPRGRWASGANAAKAAAPSRFRRSVRRLASAARRSTGSGISSARLRQRVASRRTRGKDPQPVAFCGTHELGREPPSQRSARLDERTHTNSFTRRGDVTRNIRRDRVSFRQAAGATKSLGQVDRLESFLLLQAHVGRHLGRLQAGHGDHRNRHPGNQQESLQNLQARE